MRKLVLFICLFVLTALPVSLSAQNEMTSWTCPEGFSGQTLNVFNLSLIHI